MSGNAERARRRAELAEKKRKLEEIRRRTSAPSTPVGAQTTSVAASAEPSPLQGAIQGAESLGDLLTNLDQVIPASPAAKVEGGGEGAAAEETSPAEVAQDSTASKLSRLSLVSNVETIDIAPREARESYSKGTQTIESKLGDETVSEDSDVTSAQQSSGASSFDLRASQLSDEDGVAAPTSKPLVTEGSKTVIVHELDPMEIARIESSTEFREFLSDSTTHVERALALGSKYDIFVDFATGGETDASADVSDQFSASHSLSYEHCFYDARTARGRNVADISWSTAHKDLFLVAYGAPSSEQTAIDALADGLVCLWSTSHGSLSGTPENVLSCPSTVTAAMFGSNLGSSSSELVVGACYSGQIVLWDTRVRGGYSGARSLNPVQTSPLSGSAHTQPIFSMIRSGNGRLTTISTDARVCVWSLENLLAPVEVRDLRSGAGNAGETDMYGVLSADLPSFEKGQDTDSSTLSADKVVLGCEDGGIIFAEKSAPTVSSAQSTPTGPRADQKTMNRIGNHVAPVQSVHAHPWLHSSVEHGVHVQSDFGRLLLSSSTDWTCGVFQCGVGTGQAETVLRLDHSSAVYDARWSPTHPSIISSVDESGSVNLWNLAQDSDTPVASLNVGSLDFSSRQGHARTHSEAGESAATTHTHALSRVRWANDGRLLAVGDSAGRVHTVNVNHTYAQGHTVAEEIHAFDDVLRSFSSAGTPAPLSL